jgi:hypothetical protein
MSQEHVSILVDLGMSVPCVCLWGWTLRLERRVGPTGHLAERSGALIVTWLILPVVICLSQRLSHACLSISVYTVKLRMAHYISYNLLDDTLPLG